MKELSETNERLARVETEIKGINSKMDCVLDLVKDVAVLKDFKKHTDVIVKIVLAVIIGLIVKQLWTVVFEPVQLKGKTEINIEEKVE